VSDSAQALAGQRILVTGGSGFIGRHVVATLAAAGALVRVVDLVPHPDPEVEVVLGDIAETATIAAAYDGGIDHVIHLAAVTSVLKSIQQPELTYRTNVAGTHRVLEGAREAGVKAFVLASTNAVTGPMDEPMITERAPLRPLTPYGASKAAGEMMMSAYTAVYGVRCTAIRLTNVYGLGMQAKDSIVARLMRAVRLGNGFEVYGDGRQLRDYVNVTDVVSAATLALTDERWSGPVVIGYGESISVLDVVAEVRRVTGAQISVSHGTPRAGEMPAVIVDTAKAQTLGWKPSLDFHAGVSAVWQEWGVLSPDAPAFQGAVAPLLVAPAAAAPAAA
jgi:UDP-glucose 4-epimerase